MTCPRSFDQGGEPERAHTFPERDWNHFTESERAAELANLDKLAKIWNAQQIKPTRVEKSKRLGHVVNDALDSLRSKPQE